MTATQATVENVTAAQAATPAAAPGQDATPAEPVPPAATAAPPEAPAPRTSLRALYALEFAFVFSTVISFPYLVPLIEERLPGTSPAVSGVLFALPHLCYLVTAMAVHKAFHHRPRPGLALGFLCVALGLAGHGVADSLPALTAVRLVLGAGLTLGLVCLSALAADCARGRAPGGMFGSLEFFSKAGAVAAGVAAAVGNGFFGPAAPVLTGTAVALAVTAPAALPHVNPLRTRRSRTRWSR